MHELWALAAALAAGVFSVLLLAMPSGWATLDAQIGNFAGMVFFGLIGLGYALYLAFKNMQAGRRIGWRLWSALVCILLIVLALGFSFVVAP